MCSSKITPDLLEEIAWSSWSPHCFLHGALRENTSRELFIMLELLDCLVCTFNISGRPVFLRVPLATMATTLTFQECIYHTQSFAAWVAATWIGVYCVDEGVIDYSISASARNMFFFCVFVSCVSCFNCLKVMPQLKPTTSPLRICRTECRRGWRVKLNS